MPTSEPLYAPVLPIHVVRSVSDLAKSTDRLTKDVLVKKVELARSTDLVETVPILVFKGVVQTPLGDPYPNAKVLAIDSETLEVVGEAISGEDGTWSMNLPGGRQYTFVAIALDLKVGADAKPHVT